MSNVKPLMFASAISAFLSLGVLPAQGAISGAYSGKGAHPGFTISTLDALGKASTMGLAWLKNGDMVWVRAPDQYQNPPDASANAGVWIVKNIGTTPTVTKLADQFRQPTGVTVGPDDEIVVVDLDGVYKVSATGGAKTKVIAAPATYNGELPYHGYIFCPMYSNGMYYAPYSSTFIPGGFADTDPAGDYAGAVLAWKPDGSGGYTKHAGGLRSPNGGGLGPNGIMMFTDNQGSWGPSCALNIIKPNAFYGTHQNTSKGFKDNWAGLANKAGTMPYVPPAAWLLQAQAVGQYGVGASTTQPLYMDHGAYAGDVILGDATLEGLSRVALDPVNGATGVNANYNGSVHWFTNLPGGSNCPAPNRFAMDPTADAVYVGTLEIIGQSGGAWPSGATQPFYRIALDAAAIKASFEILSVKSRAGGVEIAFSQPVSEASAVAASFALKQYDLVRQEAYGGGNNTSTAPAISSVQLSQDGSRVFLGIGANAKIDRVLSITAGGIRSRTGNASLVYNATLFTHNYQSTVAFSPTPVSLADRAATQFMNNHVMHTMLPGGVKLRVDLKGAYTLSLSKLNGATLEKQQGFDAGEFSFKAPGQGLYIVEVRQGGRAYTRPVSF
ncbi:MAG: hypothetical protein ABI036_12255 [Fibrobacteria bacterium]